MNIHNTVIIALAALLAGCGGGGGSGSTSLVPPSTPTYAGGVHFGYYWTDTQQLAETVNHVDTIFIPLAVGSDNRRLMYSFARSNHLSVIAEIEGLVYDGKHYIGNVDGARDYFDNLRANGFLDLVIGVYPADEPDLHYSDAEVTRCNTDLRTLFASYGSFSPHLAVVYSDHQPIGLGSYDWIGHDRYPSVQTDFAISGTQCKILINGAAEPWHDHPDAAVTYAKEHSGEVCLYMPFNYVGWADDKGNTYQGIRTNGLAHEYCKAGQELTLKKGGC